MVESKIIWLEMLRSKLLLLGNVTINHVVVDKYMIRKIEREILQGVLGNYTACPGCDVLM